MSDALPADRLAERLTAVLGARPTALIPLSGGCVARVYRADLPGGAAVAVKTGGGTDLTVEAAMLRYLAAHTALPVPAVRHAEADLLVMDHIAAGDPLDDAAQAHAADLLAALHGITAPEFGFARDTLIGPLRQPNRTSAGWRAFFRDRRLLHMADEAGAAGQLPAATRSRIDDLAGKLDRWIDEPPAPALIHGDMWGGNILCRAGHVAGFIDPAIYYADPEIELAFATLFGTFGRAFFDRYGAHRPLAPGFFEERRDLYNLYPLLVHLRLFGGAYLGDVERVLARFGC